MGTATQQVLALPELLSTILQHVHADQSLLSCMLVNSLWEHEATTIQWAEVDELPLQNTDPDRQQYYSDKVRKCSVKLDDAAESMLSLVNHRSLVFPRLKSVKLHGYQWDKPTICDSRLHPLLPSTLRNIEIELHDLDNLPSLLELTAKRCNQVTKVTLADYQKRWRGLRRNVRLDREDQTLLVFLRDLSSVKHFEITGLGYLPPSEYLLQLLSFPQLQSLGLEIHSSLSQWNAFETRLQPLQFANLRSLNISSSFPVLVRMCHLVPILTSLEMTCRDGVEGTLFERGQLANQLFNAIMRFSELHTLKLCTTTSEPFLDHAGHYGGLRNPTALPITASLLESITAHHPHLKILHFSLGGKGGWIEPTFVEADIDDSDIERLARNLPRLSSFEFCVTAERKSKLSAASLVALGTHCRALERLLFIPNVDLRALDHLRERPLFPNLTNWDVGFSESFRATEGTSPAIAFLDFHCPRLRTIGGRYLALSRRPWELVKYFTVGPNCLNGFDLREEMWDDGYGSYYYSMPRGSTPSVIESEPSVWGNELFESDEASTDEEEQSCSCSGSECGSDCSGYDSETRDRR